VRQKDFPFQEGGEREENPLKLLRVYYCLQGCVESVCVCVCEFLFASDEVPLLGRKQEAPHPRSASDDDDEASKKMLLRFIYELLFHLFIIFHSEKQK